MKVQFEDYEPAHLSYSTIDGYRTCGFRFKAQKVLRLEQRPGLAALGGNAVHTATEWSDMGDERDATALFRRAWDEEVEKRKEQSPSYDVADYIVTGRAGAAYGGKRNIDWWMDNGPKMVEAWTDWREETGWSIWETPEGAPAIELELNVALPGDVTFKMFLDRVMVTKAGQLVVVDLKTGRDPETPEQLGLYATGLEQQYGEMFRPDWGYYWSAQKGSHGSPLPLGMYTAEWFSDLAGEFAAGVNAGSFMAKPANSCFNWCSVAKNCPAAGGSLSA